MEMVRYCPVCDDEFRPDITVCSDCGTTLILQKEGLGAKGVTDTLAALEERARWQRFGL